MIEIWTRSSIQPAYKIMKLCLLQLHSFVHSPVVGELEAAPMLLLLYIMEHRCGPHPHTHRLAFYTGEIYAEVPRTFNYWALASGYSSYGCCYKVLRSNCVCMLWTSNALFAILRYVAVRYCKVIFWGRNKKVGTKTNTKSNGRIAKYFIEVNLIKPLL